MSKLIFTLRALPHPARANASAAIESAPDGYIVTISEPTRSSQANARMWCLLSDVSKHVEWYGRKLSPEEWKDVLSASYRKQDVVPGIDGTGFVVLGMRTSQMSSGEMHELQLVIEAFGAERGVKWSEEAR